MTHPWVFWIGFHLFIFLLLAFDLGVLQRRSHVIKFKEALMLTCFWIVIALLFNLFVYFYFGSVSALEFFTGYVIEKSLSVDNLFLFLLIFSHFKTPVLYQHKILFWGIIGALVFRISLILGGVALIDRFHFVFYLFGALLLWSGFKLLQEKKQNFSKGFFYKLFHRLLPVSRLKSQGDFFVKTEGGWKVTNLFLVLLAIECADIVFALDSVPAIFAITTDPFIVYTSNVFAILGLRAMHFLLSPSLEKLKFLKKGLAAITIFIGIKMLISSVVSIPLGISLAVIVLILGITVLTSLKGALAKPQ